MRAPALAFALTAAIPAQLTAQRFSASISAWAVNRHIGYEGPTYLQQETHGLAVGGAGSIRFGRVVIRGSYLTWKEEQESPGQPPVRSSTAAIGFAITSWLEVGPEVLARRFGYSEPVLWSLTGVRLQLRIPMTTSTLTGIALISAYPLNAFQETGIPVAYSATIGLQVALPRSPFALEIGFRAERFDMENSANLSVERRDTFAGVTAGIVFRR